MTFLSGIIDSVNASSASMANSSRSLLTRAMGGDVMQPYNAVQSSGTPFGYDERQRHDYARQYRAAMRDHQFAAIRPLAVKVAEQTFRVGRKPVASAPRRMTSSQLIAKSMQVFEAPEMIGKSIESDDLEVIESHPIIDLFIGHGQPNREMSKWGLLYCTAFSLEAVGEAIWWFDIDGESRTVWYWPRNWIKPVAINGVAHAMWKVSIPGVAEDSLPPIPDANILHFKYPNPADPTSAHSPTVAQTRAINTDDQIQEAQLASMKNAVRPTLGVVIGDVMPVPGGGQTRPELTPEQRKQIMEAIRLGYRGALHNGDPIILDGLISDIKQIFPNAADLDFPAGSSLTRDRIYQGYGTNRIVAGQVEGANRASAAVAHEGFYDLKVGPVCTLIGETVTQKLAPAMSSGDAGIQVWLTIPKAKDAELQLRQLDSAARNKFIRPSEYRKQIGLPPDKELDDLFMKQMQNAANPPQPPAMPPAVSGGKVPMKKRKRRVKTKGSA